MFARFEQWRLWPAGLIAAATLATYAAALSNDFVSLDDGLLILKNPIVHEISPRTIWRAFTSYDPEFYIPLTFLSYQLDFALAGPSSAVFHLTNLLLHIAKARLGMAIAGRLSSSRFIGFFTALLFALHPINAEAVAWAAARKDLLSSFFFLLSLLLYLGYRESEGRRRYLWSIAAFSLGLLAKVSIVLLPAVLLLIDWAEQRPRSKAMFMEKIPYTALSIVFVLVALGGESANIRLLAPGETLLRASKSAAMTLLHLLWPARLTLFYPQTTPVTLSSGEFLIPLLASLAFLALLAIVRRHRRFTAAGLFFLLMMLPSFATFSKNGFLFFTSDRYAYLAGLGIFALAATALERARIAACGVVPQRCFHIPFVIPGALVATFMLLSFAQSRTWKDSETLYTHAIGLYPNAALAYNNLGNVRALEGQRAEALALFKKAIEIHPRASVASINAGNIEREQGQYEQALQTFRAGIAALPESGPLATEDLGLYSTLGEMLDDLGRNEEALQTLQTAIARSPDAPEPPFNLGLILQKHGKLEEAKAMYEEAIRRNRRYASAHYYLAAVDGELGLLEEAAEHLEAVLRLDPSHEKAREHLANIRRMIR